MMLVKRGIDIWTEVRSLLAWRKSMSERFGLSQDQLTVLQLHVEMLQHHVDVLEAQVASLQRKAKRELGY